ncbi:hypothetical protein JWS13_12625 [Rhodococcus pseudokoreensis]|uniref:Phospholipid/cholesterol/gamma-HCH transport system substrate-binding protein n=1 Tax=Rhodococcus pseudokoreensis TaxID=2811421 RepID=A0A974ZT51_9NOCA|nr:MULTISPECIES: hypothetical protein [Rhodococcus]OUS81344.1 hypothetical protein CA951_41555 [Rhodococcus sp. NCIMB 12038]QSE89406.1 hypothetical protein JWS13_12625 [Rhodococcus pseudokoreensis]
MISKKAWSLVVLVLGVVPAVVLCALNGFFPSLRDVSDPLGRPSALSLELIDSAGQFDSLSALLLPKHAQLATDIQTLTPLANDLEGLTTKAGELSGLAKTVNASTSSVGATALPLPDLVASVTSRADQASPTVAGLSTAVGSVTTQLEGINQGLTTVGGSLGELGPKASAIATTLSVIREEAAHVQEFGPLLAVVGPPVNELNLPPLGVAPAPASTPPA